MNSCEDNVEEDSPVDPTLEKMREEGLTKVQDNYEKLAEEVEDIHSVYLFHSQGKDALRNICLRISSTPANTYYSSWKDLASELGLSFSQIGCIENYNRDFTEMVLLTFCQKSDASLAKLVHAFIKVNRLDVLSIAAKMFPALADYVKENCNQSNRIQEEGQKKLLKPFDYRAVSCQLPITLQEAFSQSNLFLNKKQPSDIKTVNDFANNFIRKIENIQNETASPLERPITQHQATRYNYNKKVMLTFASDCTELAKTVATEFRIRRGLLLPSKVLILDEHQDKVMMNPAHFIAHQFAQMDFVIPILSEQYFDCLCNNNEVHGMDLLDEKYVKLIFDFMIQYYTENNCKNDKIRCIVPKRFSKLVFNNKHFKMYPIFKVYTFDSKDDIEKLVKRLVSVKRRK